MPWISETFGDSPQPVIDTVEASSECSMSIMMMSLGAFLIPYLVMLCVGGLPMFYMCVIQAALTHIKQESVPG